MKKAPRFPHADSLSVPLSFALVLSFVLWSSPRPLEALASVGLSSVRAQTFGNESLLFFEPEIADRFGWSVAAGDFNGDGAEDLAVGMPSDDGLVGGGLIDVGIVIVRWGIPGSGLATGLADTVLSQYAAGSQGAPESNDEFGAALAVGDFNGDGYDDLAVGVPGDNVPQANPEVCGGPFVRSGSVVIHYGLPGGIQTAGEHWAHKGMTGNPCSGWTGERFGAALAAGDFNGDGWGDLAVGDPREYGFLFPNLIEGSGAVYVLLGHFGGLVPWDVIGFNQDSPGVENSIAPFDEFGFALAAGDANRDFRDDLAVGVPGENGVGAVQLFLGGAAGIVPANDAIWGEADVVGTSSSNDRFGSALAFGDFDYDGYDDLVIGTPLADLGATKVDAGRVSVMYGSASILTGPLVAESFTQGSIFGVATADGANDRFGQALAVGDFDDDFFDDLAVGQPGDDLGGVDRGGVTVLTGGFPGGLYGRYRFFSAGVSGIPPSTQDHADMGHSLAAGNFDGDFNADLAIGVPYRNEGDVVDAGAVTVLYGASFADGFDSNNLFYWSTVTP